MMQAEGWGADEIAAEQIVHDGGLDLYSGEGPGEWGYPEVVDAHGGGSDEDDLVLQGLGRQGAVHDGRRRNRWV